MIISKRIENKIKEIINNYLQGKGVDLVGLRLFPRGNTKVVRCIVDYGGGGITISDCSAINKDLFKMFEKNNILGEDFTVEVNSPGVDRKLSSINDFRRIKGKLLSIWLDPVPDGKNYLEGVLTDVIDDTVVIKQGDNQRTISISQIRTAKQKIDFKRNK